MRQTERLAALQPSQEESRLDPGLAAQGRSADLTVKPEERFVEGAHEGSMSDLTYSIKTHLRVSGTGRGHSPASFGAERSLFKAAQLGLGQEEAEGRPSVRSDRALEPRARTGFVALNEQPVPGTV